MDAMMQEDEESEINYAKLKEKAHDRVIGVTKKEPAFGQKTLDWILAVASTALKAKFLHDRTVVFP